MCALLPHHMCGCTSAASTHSTQHTQATATAAAHLHLLLLLQLLRIETQTQTLALDGLLQDLFLCLSYVFVLREQSRCVRPCHLVCWQSSLPAIKHDSCLTHRSKRAVNKQADLSACCDTHTHTHLIVTLGFARVVSRPQKARLSASPHALLQPVRSEKCVCTHNECKTHAAGKHHLPCS